MTVPKRHLNDFLDHHLIGKWTGADAARSWLRHIALTRGYSTGSSLKRALLDARVSDACSRAEDWIRTFRDLGWISRGNPEPSREMRVFGIGGMTPSTLNMSARCGSRGAYGIHDSRSILHCGGGFEVNASHTHTHTCLMT